LRGTKLLLDANPACAHALDKDGISPAWIAAQGGYAAILRLLIAHKVELNVQARDSKRYPIHQAAQAGYTRVVEMILENGADPDPVDNSGVTPLCSAAENGHTEIIKMLLNHNSSSGKKVDIEAESSDGERRPIHQAAQGGHLETVQLLLAKGAKCDPVDAKGVTPLWSASQNGNADVVRALLKAGAKVNVTPYEFDRLPIHQAAQGGHLEVVRALLDFGANPTPEADTFEDSEPSPFLLACSCDNHELVDLFLERGADIKTKIRTGKGPIHFAAHGGRVKVGQLLIDKGCNIDAREVDGWTALMLAAQEDHLPFVNLLIDNHANIDSAEKDGATALWIAAQQGHASIVKRLLEAGARQFAAKETGRRPIHQAAQNGHLACVKLLLRHSPGEINEAENDGFTALTMASQKNGPSHLSVMRYLVSQGAKVM
jgi:serine/threonine-protein phosphatase 6 regulatory ankyrin repeat subunit B